MDRLCLRIHLLFVLGQLSKDSLHAYGLPHEYIMVVLQKLDKRAFLFGSEAGTDDHRLALIGETKVSSLGFFVSRKVVAVDASFVGIVRSSPSDELSFVPRNDIEGPAARALWIAPIKHSAAP
jgi:hypothetical protein